MTAARRHKDSSSRRKDPYVGKEVHALPLQQWVMGWLKRNAARGIEWTVVTLVKREGEHLDVQGGQRPDLRVRSPRSDVDAHHHRGRGDRAHLPARGERDRGLRGEPGVASSQDRARYQARERDPNPGVDEGETEPSSEADSGQEEASRLQVLRYFAGRRAADQVLQHHRLASVSGTRRRSLRASCEVNRLREFLFAVWRLFDRSAYRCVWCGQLDRGWAARVYPGWTCSEHCYKSQIEWLRSYGRGT